MSFENNPPEFTDEEQTQLEEAYGTIIRILKSKAVNLTKEEINKATAVAEGRLPFVRDAFQNKGSYPEIRPQFHSEEEADKHYAIMNLLDPHKLKNGQINELIKDISINSEHYAYQYGLKLMDAARNARDADMPGADTFFDMLNKHFPGGSGGSSV